MSLPGLCKSTPFQSPLNTDMAKMYSVIKGVYCILLSTVHTQLRLHNLILLLLKENIFKCHFMLDQKQCMEGMNTGKQIINVLHMFWHECNSRISFNKFLDINSNVMS